MMDRFKGWLTYKLVKLASQIHGEMFMRLCEVAVTAKYKDVVEDALSVLRLEQEHNYDNQEEHKYGTFH